MHSTVSVPSRDISMVVLYSGCVWVEKVGAARAALHGVGGMGLVYGLHRHSKFAR